MESRLITYPFTPSQTPAGQQPAERGAGAGHPWHSSSCVPILAVELLRCSAFEGRDCSQGEYGRHCASCWRKEMKTRIRTADLGLGSTTLV